MHQCEESPIFQQWQHQNLIYQMWVVHMETYLDALDLWETIEENYEIQFLSENPIVAQIKSQKEKQKHAFLQLYLLWYSHG